MIKDNGNGISQDMRKERAIQKDAEVKMELDCLCALIAQKAGGEVQCAHPEAGDCTLSFGFRSNHLAAHSCRQKWFISIGTPSAVRSSINMLKQRFALKLIKETVSEI